VVAATGGMLAAAAAARPASAQSAAPSIARYDVAVEIERSGSILVRERIDYNFGAEPRHGIFRDVPVRLRYDDSRDRVYPMDVVSVHVSPGTPADYSVEGIDGGLERIRIGDPDRTITGEHTYEIVYRIRGALNGFADHDELYWNAIGTEWDVGIDRAIVRVDAPARVERAACFTGAFGATTSCTSARAQGSTARFEAAGLYPRSGLTIVVAIPRGSVPEPRPILVERWSLSRAFEATPWTIGAAAALLAVIAAAVVWLIWRTGRDRRYRGTAIDVLHGSPGGEEQLVPLLERDRPLVEFAPPDDLRPGQIGTLLDERANTLDVSATIVDLAVRGFLRIEEIPRHGLFGKPDWRLTKLREPKGLLPYERALLGGLFGHRDAVQLSELRATFVERLKRVEDLLYDDMVREGWYVVRPDKARGRWSLVAFLALVVSGGVLAVAIAWTRLALVALPLFVGAVVLAITVRWMPRRTAKGTAMLRRIRGFRVVIDTAEKQLARFAEKNNIFSAFLPYAIVFGLTEKWATAFEQLGIEPDTSAWYASTQPFTYAAFGHAIDGFAISTAGTIAATPASSGSSGFGGGGFSGGGGGGGGGGSW
jgi:Predicted membrane protein (DUF2207)